MYYGFLRPAEIRNLKVGDIDFGNEKIRVKANPPVSSTLNSTASKSTTAYN
jgi:integrase